MSFFSLIGSFCSTAKQYACGGAEYLGKGLYKGLCYVDEKTVKVFSSIGHMRKSWKANNDVELALGGISLIRGAANTAVVGSYIDLLARGVSFVDIVSGAASLSTATFALAATGLLANALLEAASASKSWVLKSQDVDQNSLAIRRIMNEDFCEKIKLLNLSPEAEGAIHRIFNWQTYASTAFALGFTTLAILSIGKLISPQGILIGVTVPIALKMLRYRLFDCSLKNSLEKIQGDKRTRAAGMADEEERGSVAELPGAQRSSTFVASLPQMGHLPTMRNLYPKEHQSFREIAAAMEVAIDVSPEEVSPHLSDSVSDDLPQDEEFDSSNPAAESPLPLANGSDPRTPNGSPVPSDVSSGNNEAGESNSPAPSDVSAVSGPALSLFQVARAYASSEEDLASSTS